MTDKAPNSCAEFFDSLEFKVVDVLAKVHCADREPHEWLAGLSAYTDLKAAKTHSGQALLGFDHHTNTVDLFGMPIKASSAIPKNEIHIIAEGGYDLAIIRIDPND